VVPSAGRTQSVGETLDLLVHMHFPNSEAMEGGVAHGTAGRAKLLDWGVVTKVVTYGRVVWAIESFAPYKTQEWMGYSRPSCKRAGRSLTLTWSGSFVPAWRLAMFQQRDARLR
jgi:hypothetical protein